MFKLEMNNIVITKSKCSAALMLVDCKFSYESIIFSDLTISNSYHDILISLDDYCDIDLMGNTSLISNHGSVVISGRRASISGFAHIFNNTAQKYESIFQVSDSNDMTFDGEITFISNTGRKREPYQLTMLIYTCTLVAK